MAKTNEGGSPESRPQFQSRILVETPLIEPFEPLPSRIFAPQAYLKAEVLTTDHSHFRELGFLVDTGASISAIPMWLAECNKIRFDKNKKRMVPIQGIGGTVGESYLNDLTIRIGGVRVDVPCLFYNDSTDKKTGCALLGRAGVLECFNIQIIDWHLIVSERANQK